MEAKLEKWDKHMQALREIQDTERKIISDSFGIPAERLVGADGEHVHGTRYSKAEFDVWGENVHRGDPVYVSKECNLDTVENVLSTECGLVLALIGDQQRAMYRVTDLLADVRREKERSVGGGRRLHPELHAGLLDQKVLEDLSQLIQLQGMAMEELLRLVSKIPFIHEELGVSKVNKQQQTNNPLVIEEAKKRISS